MDNKKGVTVAVWDDEDMPIDDNGNRAEVLMYGGSTVGRMATAQLHEQMVGAAGRDMIKRIRRAYNLEDMGKYTYEFILNTLKASSDEANREQFEYLLGWYRIVSTDTDYPRALKRYEGNNKWLEHLAHVIEDGNDPYGSYIRIPPNSEVRMNKVMQEIQGSDYEPWITPVTFKWPSDKEYTRTHANILIGPTYFLPLEKTATDWSGVSSSRVGHFGTTARITLSDKYSRPGRETSTRVLGEDEGRNAAASMGGEVLADIMDMSNNPHVHKVVCESIVTADKPTNIDEAVDRKVYPVGGHRPLSYMKHIMECSGKGFSRR